MIIVNRHSLVSKKVDHNIVIVQLSDLHFNDQTDINKLNEIVNKVNMIMPKYIVFCGDIFHSQSRRYFKLLEFFNKLGKIAPTFITLGNHDVMRLVSDKQGFKKSEWVEYYESKTMTEIQNVQNVKLLNNESVYLSEHNVLLTGINLDFPHYEITKEDPNDFIEYVNEHFPKSAPADVFHEVSCHSPKVILNQEHFKQLIINPDLIHCGHMHHGLIPMGLGFMFPNNKGLIDPHNHLFPDLAHGKVSIDQTTGIIGGPLTSIAEIQEFKAKIINSIAPSRVDVVLVKKR